MYCLNTKLTIDSYKGGKGLSVLMFDLTEIGRPMLMSVNNDVILGLTTAHWSLAKKLSIDVESAFSNIFRKTSRMQNREDGWSWKSHRKIF